MICPICRRELDDTTNEHHLIPKSKKGKETVSLHRSCHDKIHSVFSENELARDYNTIEKLLEHPEIQKFAKWMNKRPHNFVDTSIMSNRRKKR